MADVQITREFQQIFVQEIRHLLGEKGYQVVVRDSEAAADDSGESVQKLALLVTRRLKEDFGEVFPQKILMSAYTKLKKKHPKPGELSDIVGITNPALLETK